MGLLSALLPPSSDRPTKYQKLVLWLESQWNQLENTRYLPLGRAARLFEFQRRQRAARKSANDFFSEPSRATLLEAGRLSISTGAAISDYHFLYAYILARQPRKILELGSGISSIFVAHALRAAASHGGEAGHLHTMEDQPHYFENALSICPDDLRPWVSHHLSPRELTKWRGVWLNHYQQLPEGPFDLIFTDGPNGPGMKVKPGMVPTGQPLGVINGDALRVLEAYPDHACDLIVDCRRHTLQTFARFMPPGRIARDAALGLGFGQQISAADLASKLSGLRRFRDRDIFDAFGLRN